jgi:hypothetical protein
LSRNGLRGDLPEEDFGPGGSLSWPITSELPVSELSRFAADAIACSEQAASEIRDGIRIDHKRQVSSLAEWPVSRYDEAIVSLGFMVRSMNFDLKLAQQILFFSTTSKPKSIEIP